MSRNLSDSKQERDLLNRIARLEQQMRERGTLQVQGDDTIQIAYTPDHVFSISVDPVDLDGDGYGLLGTFLCTLQYKDPVSGSVVLGDLDIAVNRGTDIYDGAYNMSAYYGGLKVEEINDLYLKELYTEQVNHHPIVKMVRISVIAAPGTATYFVHTRWRYLSVGKTIVPAIGTTVIIPDGPIT
jgi:hypothetical protein